MKIDASSIEVNGRKYSWKEVEAMRCRGGDRLQIMLRGSGGVEVRSHDVLIALAFQHYENYLRQHR